MGQPVTTPTVKYPKFKGGYPNYKGTPTPSDTLYVCPKCGRAEWSMDTNGSFFPHCDKSHKSARMRRATKAETAEGKKHLTG
jgi:hypothetical protein